MNSYSEIKPCFLQTLPGLIDTGRFESIHDLPEFAEPGRVWSYITLLL